MKKYLLSIFILFSTSVFAEESPFFYGGYGEIKFSSSENKGKTTDIHRLVTYLGYKFSDKILFNSEIEIEHGNELAIEFAHIDYSFGKNTTLRMGHILIPFGLVNHKHEPTLFPTVSRPAIEKVIIPSTWHENGVALIGQYENFKYDLSYLVGFDAENFSSPWIRGGRQKGSKDVAEDMAINLNLEYQVNPHLSIGASYYTGGTDQSKDGLGEINLNLWEAHLAYKLRNVEFKTLYTQGELSDVEKLNATKNISQKASGYYAHLSYDLAPVLSLNSAAGESLPIFIYHSDYKFEKPEQNATTINGFGINYKPVAKVTFKIDYLQTHDKTSDVKDNATNLGIGFVF